MTGKKDVVILHSKGEEAGTPLKGLIDDSASKTVDLSEDRLAALFSEQYCDTFKYEPDRGLWFIWTGFLWEVDQADRLFEQIRNFVREEVDSTHKHHLTRLKNRSLITNIRSILSKAEAHLIRLSDWDQDLELLNTPDGLIDLRTGRSRPQNALDFPSRITSVAMKDSDYPVWSAFLNDFTNDDQELQEYLQRFMGYCATGHTREQKFIFLLGPGGNGKSVFLNTMREALGSYTAVSGSGTFLNANRFEHPHAIARLFGARLVISEENEADSYLKESLIKDFTGGGVIAARELRQSTFEAKYPAKLILSGNNLPLVKSVDEAIKRRMLIVPSNAKIAKDKRDKFLSKKLAEELPQILAWIVEGAQLYLKTGLGSSKAVRQTTDTFFDELDSVKEWISINCNTSSKSARLQRSSAYLNYKLFCEECGLRTLSSQSFTQKMESSGFKTIKSGQRYFAGVSLR